MRYLSLRIYRSYGTRLWNQAMNNNGTYIQIANAVRGGERAWPKDIKLKVEGSNEPIKIKAKIAACHFDKTLLEVPLPS